MTLDKGLAERLSHLVRIVRKEIEHLNFSTGRLFGVPFTVERAEQLATDPELAEILEAFTSRFSRLQDTVGDKLLVAWLKASGEKVSVAIDNLDKAEKLELLESSDAWMGIRGIRNQMVHEYIEELDKLCASINRAKDHIALIESFANNLINDIEKRFSDQLSEE